MRVIQPQSIFILLTIIFQSSFVYTSILKDKTTKLLQQNARILNSSNQIDSFSNNNSQNKNCMVFDSVLTSTCLKCQDQLMLPDCNDCPIGFKKVLNKCTKCGENQAFCDSTNSSEYCYYGFTKIEQNCVCDKTKILLKQWCSTLRDLVYQVYYDKGNIVCEFSTEIYLGDSSTTSQYSPSIKNCNLALNGKTDLLSYSSILSCYVDKANQSLFYIQIGQSELTSQLFLKIPSLITNNFRIMKDGSAPTSITYQPSYNKKSIQQPFYNVNDFTKKLCYFNQPLYYFIIDQKQYVVDKNLFIFEENYFQNNHPQFSIKSSDNISKMQQLKILQLFTSSAYPSSNISLSVDIFTQEGSEITLSYVCSYPFNLISSNDVTFKTVKNLISICTITLLTDNPITNADTINISVSCNFKNFKANSEDLFLVTYQILDNKGKDVIKLNLELKFKEFPKKITIPPYSLNYDQDYDFQVQSKYLEFSGSITSLKLSILKKEIQVEIIGDDKNKVDPKEILEIIGSIQYQVIQNQDPTNYIYTWSCFDQVLQMDCIDAQQIKLQFPQTSSIMIPSNTLDFNGVYVFTLQGEYKDTSDSKTVKATIKTITKPLNVIFDEKYIQNNILNDQQLKFKLQYSNSNILKTSKYTHSFEIGYHQELLPMSKGQKENIIFTKISDLIPEDQLYQQITFYLRFYVFDQRKNVVAVSRRNYFTTIAPPSSCDLKFDQQITGKEVAFVDKIKIKVTNCKGSNNSKLYYQFLYYNEEDFENKEKQFPDILYRKYLTKFSEDNTVETYLPPGQIVFVVVVKDEHETKIKYSNSITIQQNAFSQSDYENFLRGQNYKAMQFENQSQFQEQLCIYSLMLESIENFENVNNNIAPSLEVTNFKETMRTKYLELPDKIPNDLMSQSLQEFNLRCLKRLYKTKTAPDQSNQEKLDKIDTLVQERIEVMEKLDPFLPEVRDTYRKKILITLDIATQAIQELSTSPNAIKSSEQSDKQLNNISQIQKALALTLFINQDSIVWDTPIVIVKVQKVDQQNLFKNYLDYDEEKFDEQSLDQDIVYNVEIQEWKQNIYSFEKSFQDQISTYLLKEKSPEMKTILQQTYPVIYPKVSINLINEKLRILADDQLELPAPISCKFNNLQGNQKVKCTQRINNIWSKSSCKTVVSQTDNGFQVTCSCSSPSLTSLVADVEALFTNDNVQDIFSESGMNQIFTLDNWYQYSCIYVLIIINLMTIILCIIGSKLDKHDIKEALEQESYPQIPSAITIETQLRRRSIKQRATSITEKVLEENNKKLQQLQMRSKQYELKESKTSEDTPNEKENNVKQTELNLLRFQTKESENNIQLSHTFKDIKKPKKQTFFERRCSIANHHTQNFQTCATVPNIKLDTETNVQIIMDTDTPDNKQTNEEDKDQVWTQYRINYVESNNHEQHTCERELNGLERKMRKETSIVKRMQTKQEKQQERAERKKQKTQKNHEVQVISLEYLQSLTKLKGVCIFHSFLQIFFVYHHRQPRLFRFTLYYNQIIWLITISATFGDSLSIIQVLGLSIVSSILFDLFKILIKLTFIKRPIKIIGFTLLSGFLVFCYYSILVAMSNSEPSEANGWIINFVIAQSFDIFISGVVTSAFKFYFTLKLLPIFKITHFLYKFTSADTLFGMFS